MRSVEHWSFGQALAGSWNKRRQDTPLLTRREQRGDCDVVERNQPTYSTSRDLIPSALARRDVHCRARQRRSVRSRTPAIANRF